jgi:hypothetical protein
MPPQIVQTKYHAYFYHLPVNIFAAREALAGSGLMHDPGSMSGANAARFLQVDPWRFGSDGAEV